jgi:flavin reductase (DIM6/NTAB) family NADH-FMN oxidoreductase RutF
VTGDDPFERSMSTLDSPCFVVTAASAADSEQRSGCLVGFGSQCSLDPARFLVCVSRANHTAAVVATADVVVVHLLRSGDEPVARLFGEETGDEVDKFARCAWSEGPGGAPVIDGLDWFVGRILDRLDVGDHVGLLLAVAPGVGRAARAAERQLGLGALHHLEAGHPA